MGGEELKGRHYLVSILDTVIPRHTEDAWKVVVDVEFKGWVVRMLAEYGEKQVLRGLYEGQVEFRILFKSIILGACVLEGG